MRASSPTRAGAASVPRRPADAVQDSFTSFLTLPQAREGDDALKLLTVIVRHTVTELVDRLVADAAAALDRLR